MGTRSFALFSLLYAIALGGCMLDRSAIGTCAPGPCADAGLMADAWVGDGDVHDAGTDAPDAFMPPIDGSPDAPDAFMVDSGRDAGPDTGTDGGTDGGSDSGMDGGPPPTYLHIRFAYTGSTTVRGFAFRVAWAMPPTGFTSSAWYTSVCDAAHATNSGTAINCDADVPEFMPSRTVDLYPVDAAGASLCTASACPGLLTDWTFTYGGTPISATEISLQTGTATPPPTIPGDPAYLRIGHLPTP